ncbi:MAG: HEAT repeat domain-containing protein [Bryobacteraceae bacterium]
MATRRIEEVLERLSALREGQPAEILPALRTSLADRVNVVVAKAAKIAAGRQLRELIPELLIAFDRLFEDPVERDPQCWGKNAIAGALRDLEYRESAPFLRGMRHVQMEPVWGKHEDTAQPLRGICLLALVACSDIARGEVLRCLVEALTEPEAVVRAEAVRGLAEMEGDEAALLLRMKARLGDEEPQVAGQVFDALWKLEGEAALTFAAGFLESANGEIREEAALALGASRFAGAVPLLRNACAGARDPRFREVLFRALSLSRRPEAWEFLKSILKTGRRSDVKAVLEALELHRENPEIRRLIEEFTAERHGISE